MFRKHSKNNFLQRIEQNYDKIHEQDGYGEEGTVGYDGGIESEVGYGERKSKYLKALKKLMGKKSTRRIKRKHRDKMRQNIFSKFQKLASMGPMKVQQRRGSSYAGGKKKKGGGGFDVARRQRENLPFIQQIFGAQGMPMLGKSENLERHYEGILQASILKILDMIKEVAHTSDELKGQVQKQKEESQTQTTPQKQLPGQTAEERFKRQRVQELEKKVQPEKLLDKLKNQESQISNTLSSLEEFVPAGNESLRALVARLRKEFANVSQSSQNIEDTVGDLTRKYEKDLRTIKDEEQKLYSNFENAESYETEKLEHQIKELERKLEILSHKSASVENQNKIKELHGQRYQQLKLYEKRMDNLKRMFGLDLRQLKEDEQYLIQRYEAEKNKLESSATSEVSERIVPESGPVREIVEELPEPVLEQPSEELKQQEGLAEQITSAPIPPSSEEELMQSIPASIFERLTEAQIDDLRNIYTPLSRMNTVEQNISKLKYQMEEQQIAEQKQFLQEYLDSNAENINYLRESLQEGKKLFNEVGGKLQEKNGQLQRVQQTKSDIEAQIEQRQSSEAQALSKSEINQLRQLQQYHQELNEREQMMTRDIQILQSDLMKLRNNLQQSHQQYEEAASEAQDLQNRLVMLSTYDLMNDFQHEIEMDMTRNELINVGMNEFVENGSAISPEEVEERRMLIAPAESLITKSLDVNNQNLQRLQGLQQQQMQSTPLSALSKPTQLQAQKGLPPPPVPRRESSLQESPIPKTSSSAGQMMPEYPSPPEYMLTPQQQQQQQPSQQFGELFQKLREASEAGQMGMERSGLPKELYEQPAEGLQGSFGSQSQIQQMMQKLEQQKLQQQQEEQMQKETEAAQEELQSFSNEPLPLGLIERAGEEIEEGQEPEEGEIASYQLSGEYGSGTTRKELGYGENDDDDDDNDEDVEEKKVIPLYFDRKRSTDEQARIKTRNDKGEHLPLKNEKFLARLIKPKLNKAYKIHLRKGSKQQLSEMLKHLSEGIEDPNREIKKSLQGIKGLKRVVDGPIKKRDLQLRKLDDLLLTRGRGEGNPTNRRFLSTLKEDLPRLPLKYDKSQGAFQLALKNGRALNVNDLLDELHKGGKPEYNKSKRMNIVSNAALGKLSELLGIDSHFGERFKKSASEHFHAALPFGDKKNFAIFESEDDISDDEK